MKKMRRSKSVHEGTVVRLHGRWIIPAKVNKPIIGVYTFGGPRYFIKKVLDLNGKRHEIRFDYVEPEGVVYMGETKVRVAEEKACTCKCAKKGIGK